MLKFLYYNLDGFKNYCIKTTKGSDCQDVAIMIGVTLLGGKN